MAHERFSEGYSRYSGACVTVHAATLMNSEARLPIVLTMAIANARVSIINPSICA